MENRKLEIQNQYESVMKQEAGGAVCLKEVCPCKETSEGGSFMQLSN